MTSITETLQDCITKFKNSTSDILNSIPRTKDQYSSLDPMLKFNFDETVTTISGALVLRLMESLKIYSLLSQGNFIQFVGPHNFLKKANEQKVSMIEVFNENIKESFLVQEIEEHLELFGEKGFQDDIIKIQQEFDGLHEEMMEELKEKRVSRENELMEGFLNFRYDCEKITKLVFKYKQEAEHAQIIINGKIEENNILKEVNE